MVEMRQTRADHPEADQDPSEPETNMCQNCETGRKRERESRDGAHGGSRERTARSAWCVDHKRKAPPDMLTGRSVQACLSREVPTDHEARRPRRPKQKTATIVSALRPSASGPRQDSDVNAKEEEAAWCRSVQEATRSTWRNERERTVRRNATHGAP